jgi:hypothetical protein
MLKQAAMAFAAVQVGRQVVGGGLSAAGAAGGAVSGLGTLLGGGGAAGAAGGAGAGGGGAALTTALTTLSAALAPLAAIFAVIAGVAVIVGERWQDFLAIFESLLPVLQPIWEDIQGIGVALWNILRPVLKLVGAQWLPMLAGGFFVFIGVLRGVVFVVRAVVEALAWMAGGIETHVVDPIIGAMMRLFRWVAQIMGSTIGEVEDVRGRRGLTRPRVGAGAPGEEGAPTEGLTAEGGAPAARGGVHNDFRGSRITVNQEFRQADPDRIYYQIVNDMRREAESRTQSGFAPALTR